MGCGGNRKRTGQGTSLARILDDWSSTNGLESSVIWDIVEVFEPSSGAEAEAAVALLDVMHVKVRTLLSRILPRHTYDALVIY